MINTQLICTLGLQFKSKGTIETGKLYNAPTLNKFILQCKKDIVTMQKSKTKFNMKV